MPFLCCDGVADKAHNLLLGLAVHVVDQILLFCVLTYLLYGLVSTVASYNVGKRRRSSRTSSQVEIQVHVILHSGLLSQ